MTTQLFEIEVLDREIRSVGFIFKERHYYVTIKFTETGVVHERWVSAKMFYDFEVGSKHEILMHLSPRRDLWCFSEAEAR